MRLILLLFLFFSFESVYACKPCEFPGFTGEVVSVFSATEFGDILRELKIEFERLNPDVSVYIVSQASRELGYIIREKASIPKVGIILSSSPEVIEDFLFPEFVDFYIVFGRDEICLAYTQESKYADQISEDNWYKILSAKEVRLARIDENLDSLGYRTLLSWKLADIYYKDNIYERLFKNCAVDAIYPEVESAILSLKAGDIDYLFTYLSLAKRKGLKTLRLPVEINLGDSEYSTIYAQSSVIVAGKERLEFVEMKGKPIAYAFGFFRESISKDCSKRFFKFLFTEQARAIFQKNGIELNPLNCLGNISEEFRGLCP